MSERKHGLPRAKVRESYLTWILWIFPIGALAICAYFLIHDYFFSGPLVTINFENADGLQEKNSQVKYLGIQIGEITGLKMAKDAHHVLVEARIYRSARGVAREGSLFWIVRPEVKLGAISGLRTIVSGNFLTVQPGDGPATNQFTGLEQAPAPPEPGIEITLLTHDLGSIQKQTPVYYWGIHVGEVMNFKLADDATTILVTARIRQEYAPLARANSEFWNAGGINIQAGLFRGLQLSAESAQTLLSGGIAFATPPDYGAPATNGEIFQLNAKESEAWKNWTAPMPLQNVPNVNPPKNLHL
jgi:paraquat-inducible protein B